jgi:S-sulfo-L-cysteine synthase (O-acetyl-L-serine-dependent)
LGRFEFAGVVAEGFKANMTAVNKATAEADELRAKKLVGEQLLDRIGNTPLVRLSRLAAEFPNVEICAKAEWFNPGGSVKDRAAYSMIRDGERTGKLRPGKVILDATSGNTGIAYAMIGAALGYRVKLCLPSSASPERKQILGAYGVEIVYTPGEEGTDGAIRRVREIYHSDPEKYFYPDQYGNPANPEAHYRTTGPEIWRQTDGRITHFVAGLGTSGTFVGTTRRLKELNPRIRCVSMQPDSSFHGLEGLKHMPTALVPPIYDASLADENIEVKTEAGQQIAKQLAREEGILVGVSAGAALWACLSVAKGLPRGEPALIVTVFPDSGEKYLSERFWRET